MFSLLLVACASAPCRDSWAGNLTYMGEASQTCTLAEARPGIDDGRCQCKDLHSNPTVCNVAYRERDDGTYARCQFVDGGCSTINGRAMEGGVLDAENKLRFSCQNRAAACSPTSWTGFDGKVCRSCAALVKVRDHGGDCSTFCARQGLGCVQAWDDTDNEQCSVNAPRLSCFHVFGGTSDAICECDPNTSPPLPPPPPPPAPPPPASDLTGMIVGISLGAAFGLLVIVAAFGVMLVYVVRITRRGSTRRDRQPPPAVWPLPQAAVPQAMPVQQATPVLEAAVPMGILLADIQPPAVPAVSVAGSKQSLAEQVEVIKRQLKLSGNITEVLQQASAQLSIDPAGKPLTVLAEMCMKQLDAWA